MTIGPPPPSFLLPHRRTDQNWVPSTVITTSSSQQPQLPPFAPSVSLAAAPPARKSPASSLLPALEGVTLHFCSPPPFSLTCYLWVLMLPFYFLSSI